MPSYEVPHPALSLTAISQGKGHLSRLEDLAQQEGYLTRIWRSNCFTSALEHLGITHCQSMSPEQKSRLALALANCQLQMLGQKTHSCSEATPLQKCTESFPDDRSYNTFTEQLAQIDSICMFHMHDSFGMRTEVLMHELADATSGALLMSSGILDALGGMDRQLQGKAPLRLLTLS
ncbi:g5345 [Coccomyxa viridis]|uniref:G5345 protein n=1 Tax=Coccomyxa viridis TaxID=1274662 RepID=A0ABP1FUV9_9CHLO